MGKIFQAGLMTIFLLPAFCFAQEAEVQYYRYTNEKGQVILSNQVPPEQINRGYEVIDKLGQVKEVIDPALTPEQRAAKEIKDKQEARDREIRKLYASFEEIDQARDLRIAQIKSAITIIEGNIKAMTIRRDKLQENAAERERNGQKVPDTITRELYDIEKHIKIENGKLKTQQDLQNAEALKFASDRQRLSELLQMTPTPAVMSTPRTSPALSSKP